ncbi:hypothetical protein SDRG_06782 [Saprolegnia diclina VS20]|uniref:EFHB C-terminal EF-hand domain-containing protein n=1 Tax=Saprolegnia diclina (strain VS20) TaxID=1156394 RepID=T0QQA5_SAPDV|nr:hypothetical protein SDRG_06782 [Saprolegnia diclina VS20]EQC36045.1 hypothetical protein SDRG_06782 [Saprolegnia diclina VS20]|eukprot:XP_008610807.1 hypothetical protein SDRG_06782 [Saprolegnia diclina VS20]
MSQRRQPLPANAGRKQTPNANESTAHCLSFEARPTTPESVRKYRKSYFAEPGTRIVHSGLVDDMKAHDMNKKYGVTTKDSDHVTDVMPPRLPSDHALITQAKLEAVYQSTKREPLGKSYTRGHVYNQSIFGSPPPEVIDTTKELIYATPFNETPDAKALYKRSHGASDPGEQKNRSYQVPFELSQARFGALKVKDDGGVASALNPELDEHVSKLTITSKNVEDMKSTFDQLGRPRNLGFAKPMGENNDHIFGVKLPKDLASAGECIQGSYSFEEQQPDADLGRPVNRGWMNATADDRAFGVPSIRSDVAPPQKRSLADAQNYGDDVMAQELLYPHAYAALGAKDTEFSQPRTKQYLADLFGRIGYKLPPGVVDRLFASASLKSPRGVGIQSFRDALNDYLDETDDNNPRK